MPLLNGYLFGELSLLLVHARSINHSFVLSTLAFAIATISLSHRLPLKHFLIFISFSFASFIHSLVVGHFLFFLRDIVLLALVLSLFSDSVFLIFYLLLFWSPLFRFGLLLNSLSNSQSILLVFDSLLLRSEPILFSPFRSIFSHNSIFLCLSCLLLWSPLDLLFLWAGSNNIFLILDPLLLWSSLSFCLSLFLTILDSFHSLLFWSKSLL